MTKPLAYTAFDGDDMIFIDSMRELAIKNGFIPINPEHALGYYLCTHCHENSKSEVMQDCLTLVTMANELWVFTHEEEGAINSLPEGVLIEILLWHRGRGTPIRFFSINRMIQSAANSDHYNGKLRLVTEEDIRVSLGEDQFNELASFLDKALPHLRPSVFIDIKNEDYKYVDWARIAAYKMKFVPVVAQHLIPAPVYTAAGIECEHEEDKDALMRSCDRIWAIHESDQTLLELQARYASMEYLDVQYVDFRALDVPKYCNPEKWSITKKESEVVLRGRAKEEK